MNKLPVVLLSVLSTLEKGSTNYVIASYLLTHSTEANTLSIKKIASECHVGIASVSRFIRSIGLDNFSDLKNIVHDDNNTFQLLAQNDLQTVLKDCYMASIDACIASIDMRKIRVLAQEIYDSESVAIFGLLKGESAVITLQADLFSLHKPAFSTYNYKEQFEYIKNAKPDALIILFSDTSQFFKYYDIRAIKDKLAHCNIWMIGSGKPEEFIKHHITYAKPNTPISHPIQLLYVAQLISQAYAQII